MPDLSPDRLAEIEACWEQSRAARQSMAYTDITDLLAEVRRLRARVEELEDAIKGVVTQRADDLCWRDVYTEMAKLVGIDFTPELICDQEKFLANCKRFDESLRSGGKYIPVNVGN